MMMREENWVEFDLCVGDWDWIHVADVISGDTSFPLPAWLSASWLLVSSMCVVGVTGYCDWVRVSFVWVVSLICGAGVRLEMSVDDDDTGGESGGVWSLCRGSGFTRRVLCNVDLAVVGSVNNFSFSLLAGNKNVLSDWRLCSVGVLITLFLAPSHIVCVCCSCLRDRHGYCISAMRWAIYFNSVSQSALRSLTGLVGIG